MGRPRDTATPAAEEATYGPERLRPPLIWHLTGLTAGGLVGSELALHLRSNLIYLALAYVVIVLAVELPFWRAGIELRLAGPYLQIGQVGLPVADVKAVETLDSAARRAALGHELVRGTFVQTRPWVTTGVRVRTLDGGTWVLSTRHPAELAAALRAAASRCGPTASHRDAAT